MFNDRFGLTQAVLEGRKTQTRRIINGVDNLLFYGFGIDDNGKQYASYMDSEVVYTKDIYFPYKVGEVVAIAQSYKDCGYDGNDYITVGDGYSRVKYYAGWTNKMFVRAKAMKHHIRITNVRVERLQDISNEDCIAEGIYEDEKDAIGKWVKRFGFDDINDPYGHWHNTPKEAYADLIDKVGKKGTWESNPWVFVYEFELVD